MRRLSLQSFLVAAWFFVGAKLVADSGHEWVQFRGNSANGISSAEEIPLTWSDSESVLWKTALPGPGSSSPVISGDRVFLTSYSGYGVGDGDPGELESLVRHLICLSRRDGKVLWVKDVPARLPEDPYRGYISEHGYASNTPVVDDDSVFVFFGKTGVLAFDHDGNERWRTSVGRESSNRRWGSASSLILSGDKVIVNASDESQSIRALNRSTGKEMWRAEAASLELAYGTPQVALRGDGAKDVVLCVPNEIWGLNEATGKLRWYAETGLPGNICPTITVSEGVAYGFGGYPTKGSFGVRLGGSGDVSQSHLLWKSRISSYVGSPVQHEGHLYWVTDGGKMICVEAASGTLKYEEALPGLRSTRNRAVYASVIWAEDRLFAVTRFSGTYVVEAEPRFEVVARNVLAADETQFNGTPAIVDGLIILRSDRFAYAIGSL